MSTFLLIGPSGGGKSCSAKHLSETRPNIRVLDLDKEIKSEIGGGSVSQHLEKIKDKGFFELSNGIINQIANNAKDATLIVVGAGSINYPEGHSWYLDQQLIALVGDPTVIYKRWNRKQFHDTLEHYVTSEFSTARSHLYENAKFRIGVTELTIEQIANEIAKIMDAH